jgi:hypothetical protein
VSPTRGRAVGGHGHSPVNLQRPPAARCGTTLWRSTRGGASSDGASAVVEAVHQREFLECLRRADLTEGGELGGLFTWHWTPGWAERLEAIGERCGMVVVRPVQRRVGSRRAEVRRRAWRAHGQDMLPPSGAIPADVMRSSTGFGAAIASCSAGRCVAPTSGSRTRRRDPTWSRCWRKRRRDVRLGATIRPRAADRDHPEACAVRRSSSRVQTTAEGRRSSPAVL